MTDRHYLLKVMGLSTIPKLITFGLTMVSFPLMVRALGASQYGVTVFIGAIAAVVESFADFGVSSAAGKEIAAVRQAGATSLSAVVLSWARLQATVALTAFWPLLAITYVIAIVSSDIAFSLEVFVILVAATWLTIALNFIRAALTSMLAFRSLTVFDACESILRSASWLVVAYFVPTTLGLASAGLVTTCCAMVVGTVLLWRLVRRDHHAISKVPSDPRLHRRWMLKESLNFLWLRLATRVFQSIPIIAFGKLLGSEVVGIIGAFARIVESVNFPFAVVGNALAVRAVGVLASGAAATRRLWDVVSRLIALAVLLAATSYLAANLLAKFLLPGSPGAPIAFALLSITVITSVISSMIAPMSDYVGALRSRNILLSVCSLAQFPAILIGWKVQGQTGAVAAYVLVITVMNLGYVKIAVTGFFPAGRYELRSEMKYFLIATTVALAFSMLVHHVAKVSHLKSPLLLNGLVVDIAVFWLSVLAASLLYRPAKRFFFNRGFLDFQGQPVDTPV